MSEITKPIILDETGRRIADALIARSAGERACELMAALASKAACAA